MSVRVLCVSHRDRCAQIGVYRSVPTPKVLDLIGLLVSRLGLGPRTL
jgi:hypothetical protein